MNRSITSGLTTFGLLSMLVLTQTARGQQRRWVVDGAGAGDFRTIQEGVDAASPGDLVFVTPFATYHDVLIDGKGISLQSGLSWLHFRRITVRNLPAGQTCSITGFQEVEFVCRDCQGDVHMGFLGGFTNTLTVENCAHVGYNGNGLSRTEVRGSQVLITNSVIVNRFGGPGLFILNSDVTVVDPIFIAGGTIDIPFGGLHNPVPAIEIKESTLRVIGLESRIDWGASCDPVVCVRGPSIEATGEVDVVLSESVVVNRAIVGENVHVQIVPDQAVIREARTVALDPGTVVSQPICLYGSPGDSVFMFASLFTANPLSTVFGELWMPIDAVVPFGSAVLDSNGDGQVFAQINDTFLPGQIITWQGVTLSPVGELRLTTPNPTIAIDLRTHP